MPDKKKSLVKRENFLCIPGWVIVDLDLKGSELSIYSNIYGFSQTKNQWFTGSAQYLADWANVTRRKAMIALSSLLDKGLIEKREQWENGVKTVHYRAIGYEEFLQRGYEQSSQGDMNKVHRRYEESSQGGMNLVHRGYELSSFDTLLYNNIEETIEDNIRESGSSPAEEKTPYAKILELYNSICKSLPKVIKLNEHRRKAIRARMHDGYSVDDIKRAFELAEASPFLRGEVTSFHADFDWIMCDTNLPKILENKYKERKAESPQTDQPKISVEEHDEEFLRLIGIIP